MNVPKATLSVVALRSRLIDEAAWFREQGEAGVAVELSTAAQAVWDATQRLSLAEQERGVLERREAVRAAQEPSAASS